MSTEQGPKGRATNKDKSSITSQPTLQAVFSPGDTRDPEERIGQIIANRYKLIRLLGQGGMGEVYLAEHVLLRNLVAIKYMRPSIAADPQQSSRFMREAHALSLLRHPNIVAIHDFGVTGNDLYLVMEFLEGKPMSTWQEGLPSLPPLPLVGELMAQALDALETAHQSGIIHRDIKPDNLFLSFHEGKPHLKLVDFGLAHIDEAVDRVGKLTSTGMIAGTPLYMSPEQCRSLVVGPPADLYSLGCVLTELLQGTPPFTASSPAELMAQHMFLPVPPLQRPTDAPPVPEVLEKFRKKLLEKSVSKRIFSATEARQQLRDLMASTVEEELAAARQMALEDRSARLPHWEHSTQPPVSASAQFTGAIGWISLRTPTVLNPELTLGMAAQGLRLIAIPIAPTLVDSSGLDAVVIDAGTEEDQVVELLSKLNKTPLERRTIVCIPSPDLPRINRLIAAGAADVLPAPISPEGLARKLQRLLRRKR